MKKPWYMEEYEEKTYLHNKHLDLCEFLLELPEHEHCELCWHCISRAECDDLFGYYEKESKSWICQNCVKKFKDLFHWTIDEPERFDEK